MTDLFTFLWLALVLFCALLIQIRDDIIANQRRLIEYLSLRLIEAEDGREQATQLLDQQNERVGAYLRESYLLSLEIDCLRRGEDMDGSDIVAQVESYLEGAP